MGRGWGPSCQCFLESDSSSSIMVGSLDKLLFNETRLIFQGGRRNLSELVDMIQGGRRNLSEVVDMFQGGRRNLPDMVDMFGLERGNMVDMDKLHFLGE